MERYAELERTTRETKIAASLRIDGSGQYEVSTGIPFFDHMLTLFSVHGFFDLTVKAVGDLEVDYHHTVEDVGLVLGEILNSALNDRKGIQRYGFAQVPMDDALTSVSVDLSKRPYLVYNLPEMLARQSELYANLFKEFFRAFINRAGMNLHVNVAYGANDHHVTESVFKAFSRALDQATAFDGRIKQVHSSKGIL